MQGLPARAGVRAGERDTLSLRAFGKNGDRHLEDSEPVPIFPNALSSNRPGEADS